MRFALQLAGYVIGLPLQILVVSALLRGAWKRFPFVFVYSMASLLATIVEIPSYVAYYTGNPPVQRTRAWFYWLNERLLFPLLFLVVLSLIWKATSNLRSRRIIRSALIVGAVLLMGISFAVHYDANAATTGEWMTPWVRDLNFGSAFLDLALWALLIGAREKDHRVLLLSGGLGIQFTGEAIGGAIRNLAVSIYRGPTPAARAMLLGGNVLIMAANLVCIYIWYQAFRAAADDRAQTPLETRRSTLPS